jgi:hypothetical protein
VVWITSLIVKERFVDTDLATLARALSATIDGMLVARPDQLPPRPAVGIAPKTSDSEAITLAVLQVVLGHHGERRWIRSVKRHLTCYFPRVPNGPGYNKRLRRLTGTMMWVCRVLAD